MRKLIILVLLLAIIAGAYHFFAGKKAGDAAQMEGAVPVSVATVVEREVVQWDEFSGRLEAVERVEIRARVGGTIDAIHFEEGQLVEKGQLLFTIDPRTYQAAYKAAKARAVAAQNDFARAKELLPRKIIAQQQYDDRRSAAEVAAADLAKAELDLSYAQIKAPISGRVSRAEITVGNLVAEGAQSPVLTTIVSIAPIYANLEIDEQSYVRYLQSNGGNPEALKSIPVQLGLSGETGFPHEGTIKSFDNELNTSAGTVRVRAVFENKDGTLLPGLYAHLRIGGQGLQKALLVNERAIGTDQDKKTVNVVTPENKVEYRVIKLGGMADGMRVVREGLKAGENIVVGGTQRVRPGAQVTPQMVPMDQVPSDKSQVPSNDK